MSDPFAAPILQVKTGGDVQGNAVAGATAIGTAVAHAFAAAAATVNVQGMLSVPGPVFLQSM